MAEKYSPVVAPKEEKYSVYDVLLSWVKRHSDYQRFSQAQFIVRSAHFYVPVLWSDTDFHLGITLRKKIGKAVLRNLVKRRIKSWFRQQRDLPICKINLVARVGVGSLDWQELCAELEQIVSSLKQKLQSRAGQQESQAE